VLGRAEARSRRRSGKAAFRRIPVLYPGGTPTPPGGSGTDFAQIQQYHCTSNNPAQNFRQDLFP